MQDAIDRGEAVFRFELFVKGRWEPVAAVRLLEVDQAALRFWPDRAGRGLVPRGFVEAMRRGTYFLSQAARPAR